MLPLTEPLNVETNALMLFSNSVEEGDGSRRASMPDGNEGERSDDPCRDAIFVQKKMDK
jgi:hypothetical protein